MSWIRQNKGWLDGIVNAKGANLPANASQAGRARLKPIEKFYTIDEVAEILKVNRRTVLKWIEAEVIPPGGYFRLPSGHIRIRESAILKLTNAI